MLKFHIKQQTVSRNVLKLHSQFQSSRIVAEHCLPYTFRSQEVFKFKAVHQMCRSYFLARASHLSKHPARARTQPPLPEHQWGKQRSTCGKWLPWQPVTVCTCSLWQRCQISLVGRLTKHLIVRSQAALGEEKGYIKALANRKFSFFCQDGSLVH